VSQKFDQAKAKAKGILSHHNKNRAQRKTASKNPNSKGKVIMGRQDDVSPVFY
jgi:hypothetical protein